MSKELITLDQILSDDLRERILEVDSKIRKFINLVNQEAFEYEKIPILDIIITRKKAHVVYEDDGNIQAKSNSLASTFKIFCILDLSGRTTYRTKKLLLFSYYEFSFV